MAKSAVFVFFSSYFKQKIVGWYASMQKFELKLEDIEFELFAVSSTLVCLWLVPLWFASG